MADTENKYYQVGDESVEPQPVTAGRWFKVGAALFSGAGLALVYIVTQSAWVTNSVESTNLVALAPQLRASTATMGCIPGLPDCSPYQKIAVSAFQAMNEGKSVRDVVMKAASQDKETMAAVKKLDNVVVKAAATGGVPAKFADFAGVSAPLGYFDPIGISTDMSVGKLLFFREAELKHGRVAMLAVIGILTGEKFHNFLGVGDIPSYLVWQETTHKFFWINLAVLAFFLEAYAYQNYVPGTSGFGGEMVDDFKPGDLKFDPLGLKPKDPKELKNLQTKELNNGRLAMFASLGMLAQENLFGDKIANSPPGILPPP